MATGPLRSGGLDTTSIEGDPPPGGVTTTGPYQTPHTWGISVILTGEIPVILSRATKRKGSRAWDQCNRQVAKLYAKASRQSDNWAREVAGSLVARYGVVALEHLNLTAMTKSAKGTVANPGKNVSAKQGLNRSLQDAALGRLAKWICVKAESAGRRVWLVPAANTSRRCAQCGHVAKANRASQAVFACTGCGHRNNADANAARNIARLGEHSETAWKVAGRPTAARPVPRLRRRKAAAA